MRRRHKFQTRSQRLSGRTLCRACAGDSYYTPLPDARFELSLGLFTTRRMARSRQARLPGTGCRAPTAEKRNRARFVAGFSSTGIPACANVTQHLSRVTWRAPRHHSLVLTASCRRFVFPSGFRTAGLRPAILFPTAGDGMSTPAGANAQKAPRILSKITPLTIAPVTRTKRALCVPKRRHRDEGSQCPIPPPGLFYSPPFST